MVEGWVFIVLAIFLIDSPSESRCLIKFFWSCCKKLDYRSSFLQQDPLRDMSKPIGLAEYRLTESLHENLKTALPTIEELEAELAKDLN